MTRSYTSMQTTVPPALSTTPDTRLDSRRLVIARVIWATLAILILALFALMLPAYFTQLQTICTTPPCTANQLTPDILQMLQAHGFSVIHYAVFALVLTLLATAISFSVVLLILSRRSKELIEIVYETIQPAHVSLWLREVESKASPALSRSSPHVIERDAPLLDRYDGSQ